MEINKGKLVLNKDSHRRLVMLIMLKENSVDLPIGCCIVQIRLLVLMSTSRDALLATFLLLNKMKMYNDVFTTSLDTNRGV